jgi:hypothetical protein
MAWLERRPRVENGLVELSLEAHLLEGLYIARTLVQDHWELPMMVLNATRHEQMLRNGPTSDMSFHVFEWL